MLPIVVHAADLDLGRVRAENGALRSSLTCSQCPSMYDGFAESRSLLSSARRRNDAVHAQIFDHLPVVIVRVGDHDGDQR